MMRLTDILGRRVRWESLTATLAVAFVLVGGFFMVHCGSDHGMDPDLCALTLVAVVIVPLAGPLLSGQLHPWVVPALVFATIAPLDLPPKLSRS